MEDALIGKRFLLVEDNEINREIGKEMLFALGADVEIAVNGQGGLPEIRRSRKRAL